MARTDAHDEQGREELLHPRGAGEHGPNRTDVECMYVRKDGWYAPADDGRVHPHRRRRVDHVRPPGDRRPPATRPDARALAQPLPLDEAQAIARLGGWDLDLRTWELTISRQMFRLLGLDPDHHRIETSDFWDRVLDGDRLSVLRAMREAQRTRTDFTFDARVRRDDGTLRVAARSRSLRPRRPGSLHARQRHPPGRHRREGGASS